MSRQKDVDWSDWKGYVERPAHPLSRPLSKNIKTGADAVKEALSTGDLPVMQDTPRQPTDEEMFGHLVVTEEQIVKAEYEWENRIKLGYEAALKPLENQDSEDNREWGNGKSFNSTLSREELEKRNRCVD